MVQIFLNGENFNSAGFAAASYDWNHAACGLHIPQCAQKKKHTQCTLEAHTLQNSIMKHCLLQLLALSDFLIHKVCLPLGFDISHAQVYVIPILMLYTFLYGFPAIVHQTVSQTTSTECVCQKKALFL